MPDACRLRLGVATGLVGVSLLAACPGAQSQSDYQQQQQAAFYAEMLQQQAAAQQAAQAQQGAQAQQAASAQAAAQAPAVAQAQQQALTAVVARPGAAPAVDLPAARIDGQPLTSAELAAHQSATGLARADALTDLIDVTLLKEAATRQHLPVPAGELTAEARTGLERALADKLGLDLPTDTPATVHKAVRAHLLEGRIIEILDLPALP